MFPQDLTQLREKKKKILELGGGGGDCRLRGGVRYSRSFGLNPLGWDVCSAFTAQLAVVGG